MVNRNDNLNELELNGILVCGKESSQEAIDERGMNGGEFPGPDPTPTPEPAVGGPVTTRRLLCMHASITWSIQSRNV